MPGYPAPEKPLTALGLLHKARDFGVRVVQFGDNLPLDKLSSSEFDEMLREAESLGIALEVGTRGIGHDNLRLYLNIAQRCESPLLRVVVDTKEHHPSPQEIVEILRGILPEFEQAGVILGIENHDRFKVVTLAWIIEAVNSRYVGIVLDTVNSFGALEGPEIVVDTLGRYVVNLHVKEFTVRRLAHNLGFSVEGLPAGQGMLDVPWLLARLGESGREFNAILEQWPPLQDTIEATIEMEAAWAAESITYLRTLIQA